MRLRIQPAAASTLFAGAAEGHQDDLYRLRPTAGQGVAELPGMGGTRRSRLRIRRGVRRRQPAHREQHLRLDIPRPWLRPLRRLEHQAKARPAADRALLSRRGYPLALAATSVAACSTPPPASPTNAGAEHALLLKAGRMVMASRPGRRGPPALRPTAEDLVVVQVLQPATGYAHFIELIATVEISAGYRRRPGAPGPAAGTEAHAYYYLCRAECIRCSPS